MTSRVVAPDTGLLLAIGYGKAIDPKAPGAVDALQLVKSRGLPLILLDTVKDELNSKLNDIAEVIPALQHAFESIPDNESAGDLVAIERVIVEAKAQAPPRVVRYFDALEAEVVELCRANPGLQGSYLISLVLGVAVALAEGVRARVDALRLEDFSPTGAPQPTPASVPGVTGMDFAHIQRCEQLGLARDCHVVFLVFDALLHARQKSISLAFPHVIVTTPNFLSEHIAGQQSPSDE